MTHNIPAPVADKALAERLLELSVKSTQDPLNDDGRYFNGDWHNDLTQCSHGDTGNYSNKRDGQFIATLWNAFRADQLITLAEAQAMVAARDKALKDALAYIDKGHHGMARNIIDAAIRAAATGTKEGM